jgi:alpha-1,3-rhamnosyl/mannosyltransferase
LKLIFCVDALRAPITGIGRYTYELAQGFKKTPQFEDLKYQFLLGWVDDPLTIMNKYHAPNQVQGRASPSKFKSLIHSTARSIFRAVSPTIKGMITLPYKDYIYHSPNYELPHFAGRCVSTIHDLSVLRLPQFHPTARIKYQNSIFPPLIQKGSLFITDSEFSKNELLDFFPMADGRVISIPLGADPIFCARTPTEISPFLARYGLVPGGYALSVGTIEPRKNIERLIRAYAQLPQSLRSSYPLVLVGGAGWNSKHIHELIASYSAEGWLRYLKYVPNLDLAAIYSGAHVFACVSHYEGFGLPVLEAMASGIPVLSSDVASLPEVGGDAVHYVNPNETEQITLALQKILEDDEYCHRLSASGLARASLFSWDRTVQETIAAYGTIA